jgi:methionyl-tRNA formyltransferase
MNILVLANSDLASNYALNLLLPGLQDHNVRLLLSSSVGGAAKRAAALQQLKFFEQQLFNDLLFPIMRGRVSPMKSFEDMSSWLETPVALENQINGPNSVRRVREFAPSLILSIRYGGILKEDIIRIPSSGVINLHSGRLPQYRGVMASFWAMLAGDAELGTTLHSIEDASIDTGRILATTVSPLARDKSYLTNVMGLYPQAIDEMLSLVESAAAGIEPEYQPQEGEAAYFSFPGDEDLQRFAGMGYRLFDGGEVIDFARKHYFPDNG